MTWMTRLNSKTITNYHRVISNFQFFRNPSGYDRSRSLRHATARRATREGARLLGQEHPVPPATRQARRVRPAGPGHRWESPAQRRDHKTGWSSSHAALSSSIVIKCLCDHPIFSKNKCTKEELLRFCESLICRIMCRILRFLLLSIAFKCRI